MIKKDVVVAVLATFCLAIVLFTAVPVGSIGTYNPWLDSPSEDGKIDVRDVAPVSAAYGSTGDPTKNVNVTNWPTAQNVSYEPPYKVIYLGTGMLTSTAQGYDTSEWCCTGGYNRMSIRVQVLGYYVPPGGYYAELKLAGYYNAFSPSGICYSYDSNFVAPTLALVTSWGEVDIPARNLTVTMAPYYRVHLWMNYDVPYPQYWTWMTIAVYVYLRNE